MLDEAYGLSKGLLKLEKDDGKKFEAEEEEDAACSPQELERIKEECKTNRHVKPPYSYIALITMAVLRVRLLYCLAF